MHHSIIEKKDVLGVACRRHNVKRLAVFGSAARAADFSPDRSDADLLVDFGPWNGHDSFLDLKEDVEGILGRSVDLVDRKALDASRNYIRRARILADAEIVYEE